MCPKRATRSSLGLRNGAPCLPLCGTCGVPPALARPCRHSEGKAEAPRGGHALLCTDGACSAQDQTRDPVSLKLPFFGHRCSLPGSTRLCSWRHRPAQRASDCVSSACLESRTEGPLRRCCVRTGPCASTYGSSLNPHSHFGGWGSYPCFTCEETEDQKDEVAHLGSNGQKVNGRARAST